MFVVSGTASELAQHLSAQRQGSQGFVSQQA